MERHVGEDHQVLKEGEEGVDSCLTVLVVASEEVSGSQTTADVKQEETHLPAVWCHFLWVHIVSPDHLPQSACNEHVHQRAPDEHDETIFVNIVGFGGRHVCEQQQAGVLGEAAEESQPTQQKLWQSLGKAAAVEAEVGCGHQVARRRVQTDAATPDVALWNTTDGGTNGREVVWYMTVCKRCVLKVVHQWNEEAGDEAGQRQQHRPHGEAGEREPDEGTVPVQAGVRPLEHPLQLPGVSRPGAPPHGHQHTFILC